jgi:peptide/nickel transport system permease protein
MASAEQSSLISTHAEASQIAVASQWQLMWRKLRRHKLAMFGMYFLIFVYTVAIFCEFFAPYTLEETDINHIHAPPHRLRFVGSDGPRLVPAVAQLTMERDPRTMKRVYTPNLSTQYPVRLFVRGAEYELLGLIPTDVHLFGVEPPGRIYLLGTDRLGRDLFSRILYGSRISLSIGLIGVAVSLIIGIVLGGVSGYYAGVADLVIQRAIEIIRSFPVIPLWMALSAAIPVTWPPLRVYFGITIIISFIGWTSLARVVRGKLLSLRQEDFVTAALISGSTDRMVVMRHLVPGFLSYIIVSLTLAIPGMILGETSLSFLGIGLRPPITSWGVLLKEAQNIRTVAHYPWLLLPVLSVITTVLAFNFLGDGLRDAADPYKQ